MGAPYCKSPPFQVWWPQALDINILANTVLLPQMRNVRLLYMFVSVYALLLFSVKYMVCHVPHAPRIAT